MGQMTLDVTGGFDKVHRVIVVLFNTGGHGKNIRVENNVLGWEADLVHQDAVGPFTDLDFAIPGVGLTNFIKSHDNNRSTVAANQFSLLTKLFLTLFEADGV